MAQINRADIQRGNKKQPKLIHSGGRNWRKELPKPPRAGGFADEFIPPSEEQIVLGAHQLFPTLDPNRQLNTYIPLGK